MNEQFVKAATVGFLAQLNVRGITNPADQERMLKAASYRGNVRAAILQDIQEKVAAIRSLPRR